MSDRSMVSGWIVTDGQVADLSQIMSADEAIDLHSHSRHSDGDWTPSGLVEDAKALGLRLLSLTDHDNVGGQTEAKQAAADAGLLFLNGMEVSLSVDGRLYHVLCYDFDPESATWRAFARARQQRFELFFLNMFEQMRTRGCSVDPDLARGENGLFVGDPLVVAVQKAGLASTPEAASQFVRGLNLRRPVELLYQPIDEFGMLLQKGDAIFSVAHPARQEAGVSVRLNEADLDRLVAAIPLVALEAYHPYHSAADVEFFRQLALARGLAVTTGSDAHGARLRRPLRKHPASLSMEFLRLVRDRWLSRVPVTA